MTQAGKAQDRSGAHDVIVIGGPTASGKSGLALDIALARGGAIINADSMQVYDGLPRLTAQPPPDDLRAAPHLLYGALAPAQVCSAARWRDMALAAIDETLAAGRLPVVVGGTGFYIRTLTDGISPMPEVPVGVRTRLAAQIEQEGNEAFHRRLAARDPVMAARLHPSNTQRLIRAMEVLEHTGKSLAEWQALPADGPPPHLRFIKVALLPPRDVLYPRCDKRFLHMIDEGVLEEVQNFPVPQTNPWPLHKALGYPELRAYLDGTCTRADAIAAAQQSTRHYAKRQVTWFRHQMDADIVLEEAAADAVLSAF